MRVVQRGEMKVKGTKSRDIGIDFIRVLACTFVITIHVKRPDIIHGDISKSNLLISSIVGDAVTLFFAITGCFLFRSGKEFKGVLKKFFLNVFVPMIVAVLCIQIFRDYLVSPNWIVGGAELKTPQIKELLRGLFERNPGLWNPACGVYWYMFEYGLAILWYPIVLQICNKDKSKVAKAVIFFTFINLALGEIQLLVRFQMFYIQPYLLMPVSVVDMMLGHVLYDYCNNRKGFKYTMAGLLIFTSGVVMRFLFQYKLYGVDKGNVMFLYWDRAISFINVTGIVMFAKSINWSCLLIGKIIEKIAPKTFYIYLVHQAVVDKVRATGLGDQFWDLCSQFELGILREASFIVMMLVTVLLISYAISLLIKKADGIIKDIFNRKITYCLHGSKEL